ncbi:MAG: pyruvate formate lyase-activating protein [Bacilli bacterium]|nr:pyruvate formate lyase-activating protein [Bacilli bacterium]
MNTYNLYVDSIETMGLLDGPGVRVVVFLSGCNLRCLYCHNPETWACKGKEYTVDELYEIIMKYYNYIKNGGVTFSGGEPLLQASNLKFLVKKLKASDINVAIDTAGYIDVNKDVSEVLKTSDLIIMDVKATDKDEYLKITRGNIKLQDDFIKAINRLDTEVWIRQVIVPGINDDEAHINSLNNYVKQVKNLSKVELLGYHDMAIDKYKKLKIPYLLMDTPRLTDERLSQLQNMVKIG